ncbi:hypothetical protein DTO166G4_4684 [Paecilomyces variotii]|nr:hypothetical protein DTO166G4_4684 [Paecilomyces variotii]KAJ9238193.1 hypothetical protein DTO166G5_3095 [Paecilomyces variotii]KAJ9314267.1 hypothetical protein DTO271D3_5496 [Paecilomyces variotii]KAJ9387258.1 hypothetical protein DTO063F5_3353 [Paecilomyces variotii]
MPSSRLSTPLWLQEGSGAKSGLEALCDPWGHDIVAAAPKMASHARAERTSMTSQRRLQENGRNNPGVTGFSGLCDPHRLGRDWIVKPHFGDRWTGSSEKRLSARDRGVRETSIPPDVCGLFLGLKASSTSAIPC